MQGGGVDEDELDAADQAQQALHGLQFTNMSTEMHPQVDLGPRRLYLDRAPDEPWVEPTVPALHFVRVFTPTERLVHFGPLPAGSTLVLSNEALYEVGPPAAPKQGGGGTAAAQPPPRLSAQSSSVSRLASADAPAAGAGTQGGPQRAPPNAWQRRLGGMVLGSADKVPGRAPQERAWPSHP